MLYNFQYLTKENFQRESDNLVICGNGPSLADINYNLIPDNFDVFRCNQFYQEDNYFMGKRAKLASLNEIVILENYTTYKYLVENNEYYIENIVINYLDSNKKMVDAKLEILSEILTPEKLFGEHKELISFLSYSANILCKRPTSGIYLTILGVMLGYKNFYLAGIDLMQPIDNKHYVYNLDNKEASFHINKSLINNPCHNDIHTKEFDLQVLNFLITHYDINIFSLSEKSPLSQYITIPQSSSKPNNLDRILKVSKKSDATLDFIILNDISTSCLNNLEFETIRNNYKRRIARWHRRLRSARQIFKKMKPSL